MLTPYLLIACMLAGQPTGNEALKTDVARLVRKLDADTAKERKEAEEQLIQLGPAVLDLLPAPNRSRTKPSAVPCGESARNCKRPRPPRVSNHRPSLCTGV